MIGVLAADWIKIRRTWIKALIVLGPFGVISLNAVRYALQYHRLVVPGGDNWGTLLQNVNALLVPALVLGIAIVASMMSGLEHQGNQWKQLLAMPVSRVYLYVSKFIWLMGLLAVSATLVIIGAFLLGYGLGIESSVPLSNVLAEGFQPYLGSYALIGLQLLLSVLLANQVYSIVVGVLGIIASFAYHVLPHWLPWEYPMLASPVSSGNGAWFVGLGIALGILLLGMGAAWFVRCEAQ